MGNIRLYWTKILLPFQGAIVICYNRSLQDLLPISMGERIFLIAGVVFWEGLMYTLIHKAFHEVPALYRFHKFHHQFNDIVLPSSANAVSTVEFVVAYMMPIVASSYIMNADELSAVLAVAVISLTNLLIHTPALVERYQLPWFGVSTQDHLNHHQRLTSDYAAPLIHFDRLAHALVTRVPSIISVTSEDSTSKIQKGHY